MNYLKNNYSFHEFRFHQLIKEYPTLDPFWQR